MKEFFKNSLPYFKRYLPIHILATLFGLFRMVIVLATPQVVALLVDRVINPLLGAEPAQSASVFSFLIDGFPPDDYVRIFWTLAIVLLVFAVAFFVCFYLKWNLAHYFSLKSERKMRTDALNKVNSASSELLAKYSAGDLILITTKDPSAIRDMYIGTAQFILDNLFYIVVSVILLWRIHFVLLFAPLAGSIAIAVLCIAYQKRIGKHYECVWRDSSSLSTTVQESVYGIRTVVSFSKEEERRKIFGGANEKLLQTNLNGAKIFGTRELITQIIRAAVLVLEVALGIYLGIRGIISAGSFMAMTGYIGMLLWQIASFLFNINGAQKNVVSAKRFFGFLNEKDEDAERYGADIPSARPHISIKDVCVKNGEVYALDHISLDLPYGKKLGVMGRTGSGKTLLVKVMQGLAEAHEGEVYLDEKPVHAYDRNELARAYSYAMQNVFLFSNTIAANIALYDPDADREQIERAGALAEVNEFAARFPEGYDTTIGEKGFGLSGGQKQRISIARALFKNARILIFDDVTSALDLETEQKIFRNLEAECGKKTLILVTHRATALKECDEIVFLEEGRITERGTFEHLMAQNGNFAEIYRRQVNEIACAEGKHEE